MLAIIGYVAPVISTSLLIMADDAEPSTSVWIATALITAGGLAKIERSTRPVATSS